MAEITIFQEELAAHQQCLGFNCETCGHGIVPVTNQGNLSCPECKGVRITPILYEAPYFIAKQKAIDYHRRYTLREVYGFNDETGELLETIDPTPDMLLVHETKFLDANLSPESRTLFNNLVRLLFEKFCMVQTDRKISTKYLSYLIRSNNLEHILEPDLQSVVERSLRGASPMTQYEFAEACQGEFRGKTTRGGSRVSNEFAFYLTEIKRNLRRFVARKL